MPVNFSFLMGHSISTVEVYYTGRVQGVGFRAKTLEVARGFEVLGEVKNLSDGRVQLNIQGPQAEVAAFLDELSSEMRYFIREADVRRDVPVQPYQSFSITH